MLKQVEYLQHKLNAENNLVNICTSMICFSVSNSLIFFHNQFAKTAHFECIQTHRWNPIPNFWESGKFGTIVVVVVV